MASAAPTFSDLSNTTITVTTSGGGTGDGDVVVVDDLTALKARTDGGTINGVVVKDAGGTGLGVYTWNSTSTSTDDGLSIIEPDAGGTGRWIKGL